MNSTSTLILLLIITIGIILIFREQQYPYENFTNDEAIQNVASLYNSGMATVTNLNATTSIKTPTLSSDGRLHISGNELLYLLNKNGVIVGKEWGGNGNLNVQGDATVNGGIIAKGNGSGNTHFPFTDGNNYITSNNNILRGGPTTVQGNLNVSGTITEKVNVVYPIEWDQDKQIAYITNNKFFNKNMPDGTLLKFLFVHPGGMNLNHPNRWIKYVDAIKYGNQFIFFVHNTHENIENPLTQKSSRLDWRGNIN
jgi:hypothetical protein